MYNKSMKLLVLTNDKEKKALIRYNNQVFESREDIDFFYIKLLQEQINTAETVEYMDQFTNKLIKTFFRDRETETS